jgi:membrane-bound serine protease (ClpP class)
MMIIVSARSLARLTALLALPLMVSTTALAADATPPVVATITMQGAIDVPSAEYLSRALQVAEEQGAQCLVILLDTPGGLSKPMKDMTESLLNAPIPTVVYVYPAGAYAISAGTFVTLSAHIAAMHPVSTIGAAHPVQLFSMPQLPEEPEQPAEEGEETGEARRPEPEPEASSDVMMEKVVNTFALQARAIAEARGRNAEWAERAVRESAALSASEAFEQHVVDLLADDVDHLLRAIDGREISLPGGRTVTLVTAGAPTAEIPATAKERFLHVLADPNILLVLLVLAGLGILFELQNPGAILPGVIGGLCLLLALYSMAVLPVNYAGVALILFAMLLFLAEVKMVSHGVLTVGGVASFVIGALMLIDTGSPFEHTLQVSWQVVIVMTVLMLLFFFVVVGAAIRAHMRKVETGEQGMLGVTGRALNALSPNGNVLAAGERWRARAVEGSIGEGESINVVGQEGLRLLVRRRQGEDPAEENEQPRTH